MEIILLKLRKVFVVVLYETKFKKKYRRWKKINESRKKWLAKFLYFHLLGLKMLTVYLNYLHDIKNSIGKWRLGVSDIQELLLLTASS